MGREKKKSLNLFLASAAEKVAVSMSSGVKRQRDSEAKEGLLSPEFRLKDGVIISSSFVAYFVFRAFNCSPQR